MKILVFSDIHNNLKALKAVMAQSADVYICAGDLVSYERGLETSAEILEPLGQRLWMLPGNHESHAAIQRLCAKFGFVDFHRQVRVVNGTHWVGLGYSNITPFKTPGEYSEDQIAKALAEFGEPKPMYAVVHTPPFGSRLDEYAPGQHAGSAAVRQWIDRVRPVALYCGHIHETAGRTETVGETRCVNVGPTGVVVEI